MMNETKIVLDADVIIHFIKAGQFSLLFEIFPKHQYLLLDVVYDEVTKRRDTKTQIDNTLLFFGDRIKNVKFAPKGESIREYARLLRLFDPGECACMVYCRDNQDVLGSSNLRDIKQYCTDNGITYLTTIDFLYYAYVNHKMTKEECDAFIEEVISKDSKLPRIDISKYVCSVII